MRRSVWRPRPRTGPLLVVAAALVAAPASRAAPAATAAGIQGEVERLVAKYRLAPERVGVAVVDAATGASLADFGGDRSLVPASCLKVATTAAALVALGPGFELKTRLAALPPGRGADPAVVDGDLHLAGFGDPGFSEHGPEGSTHAAMEAFAAQVAARGVRRVRGDLVFDASYFSGPRVHASWTDAGPSARWFAAEVDALTCNDGCVDVTVEPGAAPGAPGTVRVAPETAVVPVQGRVTTTAARGEHGFAFHLSPTTGVLEVTGRVWTRSTGATSPAAIRDPALLCAEQVGRALARAGVRVEGVVRRAAPGAAPPPGLALLAEHRTSLAAACAVANTRSQNLWAETVFKVLGRERGGEGSFEGGARAVRTVLAAAGPRAAAGLRPVDGSGLSRENRATAASLALVLRHGWLSPAREAFVGGLARPGVGTLDDRFRDARFRGRVFAKTGTLRRVSGLCGFALRPDGTTAAFAVLADGVEVGAARALQDAVVGALVGEGGPAPGLRPR